MVLGMKDDRSPFIRTRFDTLWWCVWHPYARAALGILVVLPVLVLIITSGGPTQVATGPATVTSTTARTVTTTASPTTVTTTTSGSTEKDRRSTSPAAARGARSVDDPDQEGWAEKTANVKVRCSKPATIFLTGSGFGTVTSRVTGAASLSGGDSLRVFGPAGTYVLEVTDSGGNPRVDWTSTSSCS